MDEHKGGAPAESATANAWITMSQEWLKIATELNPFMAAGQQLADQTAESNPFLKLFPFNYGEMAQALTTVGVDLAMNPLRAQSAYIDLAMKQFEVFVQTSRQAWGLDSEPVIVPDRKDKRFAAEEWSTYAVFNAIKQSYLLNYNWFLEQLSKNESLSPAARRRATFYLKQYLDGVSPSNSPFLNPVVIEETAKSGGENLVKGLNNLADDLRNGRISMVEGAGFEFGKNIAASKGEVVLRTPILELIQYYPSAAQVYERPILIIPPWINKYYILDLQPKNSLVKYLTDQGYTVFMVSWKNPDESYADFGMEDYLTQGILPATEAVRSITGNPDLNVVGYCIGGTLLSMGLAALRAKGDTRFNAVTYFVSLQDFAEPGDLGVFISSEEQLADLDKRMSKKGILESTDMATAMNLLRGNDLIWSYVVNNYLLGKRPAAFDLLFWNADGTRMTRKTHHYYLKNMYVQNNLVKPGKLTMLGEQLDLGKIDNDIYAVGTLEDHIVPWRGAFKINQYASGHVRFVLANSGHIAGIVSPPGGKGTYGVNEARTNDPEKWLKGAEQRKGSWWEDWKAWLEQRSGAKVTPPSVGNEDHRPVVPAPGAYVREMGGEAKYPPATSRPRLPGLR